MTTTELVKELKSRIEDGRITNIEGHLRRHNKTRTAAVSELRDDSKWESIPVYGRYGVLYVQKD